MSQLFIRAKAWQLFLLFVVPALIGPLLLVSGLQYSGGLGFLTALSGSVVIGWIWTVGVTANQRLPSNLKKSTSIFSWGLFFVLGYVLTIGIVFIPGPIPSYVIPVHIASMLFMFYALWFAAKQFVTLQRQQSAKFTEFSGPFFQLWLYPIGVWFLQPQVNTLLSDRKVGTVYPMLTDLLFDVLLVVITMGGVWFWIHDPIDRITFEFGIALANASAIYFYYRPPKGWRLDRFMPWFMGLLFFLAIAWAFSRLEPVWWQSAALFIRGQQDQASELLNSQPHANLPMFMGLNGAYACLVVLIRLALKRLPRFPKAEA